MIRARPNIVIARYELPLVCLTGGGVTREYDFSAGPPDAFVLWFQGAMHGLTTEYQAAIDLAERFAREYGVGVEDLVLETTAVADRPQLPSWLASL